MEGGKERTGRSEGEEIMWPGTGVGISQIAIHLAKAWSRQEERVVAEHGTMLLW